LIDDRYYKQEHDSNDNNNGNNNDNHNDDVDDKIKINVYSQQLNSVVKTEIC